MQQMELLNKFCYCHLRIQLNYLMTKNVFCDRLMIEWAENYQVRGYPFRCHLTTHHDETAIVEIFATAKNLMKDRTTEDRSVIMYRTC